MRNMYRESNSDSEKFYVFWLFPHLMKAFSQIKEDIIEIRKPVSAFFENRTDED